MLDVLGGQDTLISKSIFRTEEKTLNWRGLRSSESRDATHTGVKGLLPASRDRPNGGVRAASPNYEPRFHRHAPQRDYLCATRLE